MAVAINQVLPEGGGNHGHSGGAEAGATRRFGSGWILPLTALSLSTACGNLPLWCVCVRCNEVVWQGGELTVEQLQEQKRFLEEDRDHEREERNYFQLERTPREAPTTRGLSTVTPCCGCGLDHRRR